MIYEILNDIKRVEEIYKKTSNTPIVAIKINHNRALELYREYINMLNIFEYSHIEELKSILDYDVIYDDDINDDYTIVIQLSHKEIKELKGSDKE